MAPLKNGTLKKMAPVPPKSRGLIASDKRLPAPIIAPTPISIPPEIIISAGEKRKSGDEPRPGDRGVSSPPGGDKRALFFHSFAPRVSSPSFSSFLSFLFSFFPFFFPPLSFPPFFPGLATCPTIPPMPADLAGAAWPLTPPRPCLRPWPSLANLSCRRASRLSPSTSPSPPLSWFYPPRKYSPGTGLCYLVRFEREGSTGASTFLANIGRGLLCMKI